MLARGGGRVRRLGLWLALLVQGLRYRRGIAVLLVLVTALTTGTAAAAAVYRQAAAESALRARLVGAPVADSGVEVGGGASPRSVWATQLPAKVPDLPFAEQRVLGATITGDVVTGGAVPEQTLLRWRADACRHLLFSGGRCPAGRREVAVPLGAAASYGWRLGRVLTVANLTPNPILSEEDLNGAPVEGGPRPDPQRYRVVGVYRVPAPEDPYWLGDPPGDAAASPDGTQTRQPSVILDRSAFLHMPPGLLARITLDQPLAATGLTTADVPRLRRGLAAIQARAGSQLTVITDLPRLLDADAADRRVLGGLVALAAVQLLGLVGLVLVVVLALATAGRRAELAAGTLRGRRPARIAASIIVEPALLLAVGAALGIAAAPAAVRLAAAVWLRPGTPVRMVPLAPTVAAGVGLAGLAAAGVVAYRAACRPAVDQLAAAAPPARQGVAWWEVVAFMVAAAGLLELLTAGGVRDRGTPWALMAPALCGLAAALALARLVPLALRQLLPATDGSPHLSTFLLLRELRRDAVAWRITAVVAVAVSLLSFAVTVDRGAAADRRDRSGLLVGAPEVVSVVPPAEVPLTDVVATLDPTGRWAMAAVQVTPFGSPALSTPALDAPRLPAVAAWSRPLGGLSVAALATALQPSRPEPFRFRSAALTLPVTVSRLRAAAPLRLTAYLAGPDGTRFTRTGARLQVGTGAYSWSTSGCTRPPGCRLLIVEVQRPLTDFSAAAIELTLGGLDGGPWTVSGGSGTRTDTGWQLAGDLPQGSGGTLDLVRPEMPPLPPVLTAGATGGSVTLPNGQSVTVSAVGHAGVLPRLLDGGGLIDLSYAELAATVPNFGGTPFDEQVWLGRRAPPDAVARLQARGVSVLHVDRTSTQLAILGYLAPAAGLDGYLAVALLAATVALGLLAASAGVGARRRRTEYLALATAGVARVALTRAWVFAAVVRLCFAAAAGLASGLATAHLAAPGIPLASPGTVPSPQLGVPALPAVLATLATLTPLIAIEIVGVRWSARRAGLRRLREALT